MNTRFRRVAATLATLSFTALATSATDPAKQLYVTVMDKGAKTGAIIDRMVTSDAVVVLSETPIAGAPSTAITVAAHQPLYFTEYSNTDAIKGAVEYFHYGAVRLVGLSGHDHGAHHVKEYHRQVWPVQNATKADTSVMVKVQDGVATPVDDEIDATWLKSHLEEFSGAKSFVDAQGAPQTIRERGSAAGKALARQWLKKEFSARGFTVSEHRYVGGTNMVAEKPGEDPQRWLILSAHMDSVGNAGADDDGSGVITSLAIASQIAATDLKVGLRVLSFDQEEDGLLGSRAYVRNLNAAEKAKIKGVVNIEMTGYDKDGDGVIHAIHCNENTSKQLADNVQTAINTGALALKIGDACTNRSDHAAFWTARIPAIVVSQNFFGPEDDANPCYHRSCDRVDILNFNYMLAITKALTATTKQLLAQ